MDLLCSCTCRAKDVLLASMDKPTGFEFIWDDRRSVNWKDVSVWRPKCAEGEDWFIVVLY